MKITFTLLLTMTIASFSLSVSAHHPIASEYREDGTQTVEGNLTQLVLRNPHSFLYLDIPNGSGRADRWSIEWLASYQLNRQGVTAETLKAGDHLVVSGFPGLNPADHRLFLRTLTRPRDHWRWKGTFE